MTEHLMDLTTVRTELRALNRNSLLIIAERAIELIPATQLSTLLSDFVHVETSLAEASRVSVAQLDDVRKFYDAAMGGEYYETVEINSRGRREQSDCNDAFIAEFHRLLHRCIQTADQEAPSGLRESFELLFGLLRHIDEGNADVLYFTDDGGSLDVGVNWRAALPAYFNCLTNTSSPMEFARRVVEAIEDFVDYDRPRYTDAAREAASAEQRTALDALMA